MISLEGYSKYILLVVTLEGYIYYILLVVILEGYIYYILLVVTLEGYIYYYSGNTGKIYFLFPSISGNPGITIP